MESTDRALELPADFTDWVRIEALLPADSPRLGGLDENHVRRLAEIYPTLPPILVHRATMRVVDGMHRLAAAKLRGLTTVRAQYFDGTEEDSFVRSVSANVTHGLPLSIDDRKAAARRILASHPDLSDRAVASCAGLDPKTVAALRPRSARDSPRSNVRVSSNGRAHPLDRTAERLHAAELMTAHPDLPLRAIVRETGLSLGTAHDVRQRLLRGEAPVPDNRRQPGRIPSPRTAAPPADDAGGAAAGPAAPGGPRPAPTAAGRSRTSLEILRRLAADPSLRHSESGRHFLRWLHAHFVVDDAWRQRVNAVPPHCTATVAELALQCSNTWRRFAEDLTSRRLSDTAYTPDVRAASKTRR
ncbi:ParB/RepB/Spo0J family partition protein [Streptomyces sp. URMC 125]|uniref:ParB/RepB/Spo0J family partition protein n=1 Tax=Streptomyces sp. URMC 125 TaxID=3423419 RepID=UPI003F1C89A1